MTDAIATMPSAGSLQRAPTANDIAVLPLRGFLDLAGRLLGGLPAVLWVEATVVAAKQGRAGHTLELTEAGAQPGQGGQLRAFLPATVLARLATATGGPLDPAHLVGMTTTLKVEPNWSPRYHLGARVLDLSRDATLSLAKRRLAILRQALRAEGLYDRQRRLPAPLDVTRVAVIHPAGAAGYADIAAELARWEAAGLLITRSHPAPFEGAVAPQALAAALKAAVQPVAGHVPDLILMARGGGAKAGLEALDHELVVRAVALCPVPVVTGLGHAVDNDLLVAEIAWCNADTPSKAIGRVAESMRGAATQARANHAAIATFVQRRLAEASTALREHEITVRSLAERRGMQDQAALDALWADLRVTMAGLGGRCTTLATDAGQVLTAIKASAVRHLDAAGRASHDHCTAMVTTARQMLAGLDGGDRIWRSVQHLAASRLDLQTSELVHIDAAVDAATRTKLNQAAERLAAAEAVVAASSLEAALARGFAVVTGPRGRIIRTVAAARTAFDLTLMLHDGDVAAVVSP